MDNCPYCKMPPCLTCGKCWCDHQPCSKEQLPGREEAREALAALPETFVANPSYEELSMEEWERHWTALGY